MKLKLIPGIIFMSKIFFGLLFIQTAFLSTLFASNGNGQDMLNAQEVFISVELKKASLIEVFNQIESKSEFTFSYEKQDIDGSAKIDLMSARMSVADILKEVSRVAKLTFKQVNNNINVRKMKEGSKQSFNIEVEPAAISVSGKVVAQEDGSGIPGVNVRVKGTGTGTVTDIEGNYSLDVPSEESVLVFTSVGFITEEVLVGNQSTINVTLMPDVQQLSEVVVVGYGVQKKSDISGSVASLPKERLEMVPNLNIAQAIQGSIPGVMVQTTSAGAAPSQGIMVRGRNSIKASNDPLIVLDGIPYGGQIADINPNDVQSLEVLKDASAAAIYGSRGANGVILITTKEGMEGKAKVLYDGYYSIQRLANLPDLMNGEDFYQYKMTRDPGAITLGEQEMYESGEWVDWRDLALRNGASHQHNLSVSGGFKNTKYYIAGSLLDVQGLAVNDDYLRVTNRINVDTEIADWLSIGTRTQFSYDDQSGQSPNWGGVFNFSPLSRAYDEDGNLSIYPQDWDTNMRNPLESTLYKDINKSYQVTTNNFASVDFPFVPGLSYKINTGIRMRFRETGIYRGRNTKTGLDARGSADTERLDDKSTVIENILSYNKEFDVHNIFATAVYSFQENSGSSNIMSARGFPNDFLTWYSAAQAELVIPDYSYINTVLISQMLRLNYVYDSRYILTLTSRRDGYSGFGAKNKWGIFPSVALGWNFVDEEFFPWEDLFSELKLRASWGVNGNQGVGAYETIAKLTEANIVSLKSPLPGYMASTLGIDNLGWESSRTMNVGLDFGIFQNRIAGDINLYKTNTTDLLMNRTISPVHGINSITQNIGETENRGIELSVNSTNIVTDNFKWFISGNVAFMKNEIISLYGELDEEGNELDDIANAWFIGEPIRVNYDYVWEGTWQLEEAGEAALYNSQPGFVKVRDVNEDKRITAEDRQIIGQQDPKLIWGMTNSFSYRNFILNIFIHGVHGVTRYNDFMRDNHLEEVRDATTNKNWWTPDNPTNEWIANDYNARLAAGNAILWYENASFVRIKDISLSYDLPESLIERAGLDRFKLYITGRNLFTFTRWQGLDPELDGLSPVPTRNGPSVPLQREFVLGLNLGF